MRTPSDQLIQLLTDQKLCTQAELDHCEPHVRRLCQDLPDFDSVWLDALVQQRFLTAWQADQLQTDAAHTVVIGRFQRQRALGRSTWLATDEKRVQQYVLRAAPGGNAEDADHQIAELFAAADRLRSTRPAALTMPLEVIGFPSADRPDSFRNGTERPSRWLVSKFIPGWSMEELLIRGGRLPWEVVAEMGRELLVALTWLESARLLHGDLVLRNVRLDLRGGIHLVDPFARRLYNPVFALTDQLTLRDCDGVAPEQVGTGRAPDARSELYVLGCLLWELLTSRPVLLSADPVTRMMKQKDHDIADVRGPVPDCPEWMSRLIQSMTRRAPELRPGSSAEVLKLWKAAAGNSLSQCRTLARRMPDHALRRNLRPRMPARHTAASWLWPTAAATALGILVVLAARAGVLPQTLRLAPEAARDVASGSHKPEVASKAVGPVALPPVDANGVIPLEPGRTYLAERREFPGTLRIVCNAEPPAEVIVPAGKQWVLQARSLELKGLNVAQQSAEVVAKDMNRPSISQLLAVQSGTVSIDACVFQSPAAEDNFVGVAWHRLAGSEGMVSIRNSVFAGGGYAASFNHPPRRCELENVLLANRGSGLLCEFKKGDADSWDLFCTNVTQRFGFSVVDAVVQSGGISRLNLNMTASESVFSPQMAIVRIQPPPGWRSDAMHVQIRGGETGNPVVVPPSATTAVYIDRALGQPVSLPEAQLQNDGVLLADLFFDDTKSDAVTTSEPGSPWRSSSLVDFEGPKLTTMMPGIVVSRLPIK
ncbi:MAG: protein kinase [Planctomycetaceae bacterium]|nr:protein kinase [Planctomycetaceae bacterium]